MKENLSVILIAIVFAIAGIRLYQRFVKKDGGKSVKQKTTKSSFPGAASDDYEPYSGH